MISNHYTESYYTREKVNVTVREKLRILKNIIILSLAFMMHFTSFQGTANLQSSINAEGGLGTKSLGTIYLTILVSCIFLPTFVIRRLTAKWTIVASMLCYVPFIVLQMHPVFKTLIPASILLGLGAGPMWAAQSTYVTQLGQVYAIITDQAIGGIIVRFFGFFFLAWQTAELWGNLISSLVFSHAGEDIITNSSEIITDLETCGAYFCSENSEKIHHPQDEDMLKLILIYLLFNIAAVLIIILFLDSLRRYGEKRKGSTSAQKGYKLLLSTLHQMIKKKQLLLMPITVWIGIEQAFIAADFTRSYVACALGVEQIGYVMICFGVVNAICSILFGCVMKYIGRIPIMVLGAIVHFSIVAFMLFWRPHPSHRFVFFAISGLWGVGDAVWQTQINGFYGLLFRRNKEAAFSNYRLWEAAGFVIGYSIDAVLCTKNKIYILLLNLTLGLIGYTLCEFAYIAKQRRLADLEEPKLHSNMSLLALQSFFVQLLHVPEMVPSQHRIMVAVHKEEEDDDEIDELEDDVVIEKIDLTDSKANNDHTKR